MGLFKTKEEPVISKEGYQHLLYKEIKLPNDEREKALVLSKYDKRTIMIKDGHIHPEFFQGGVLDFDIQNYQVYFLNYDNTDGTRNRIRFHTHDLDGLLVKVYC
ncbi:MAG: hypothetical protein Q7S56_00695 [Nanoarchaeota archaeon]|nr:hypothetical protein [Nanoarchaeota archaeon]